MLDLFREELRGAAVWWRRVRDRRIALESLKQIRGAARIVKCEPIERVAIALCAVLRASARGRIAGEHRPRSTGCGYAVSTLAGCNRDGRRDVRRVGESRTAAKLAEIASVFERPRPLGRRKSRPSSEPRSIPPVAPITVDTAASIVHPTRHRSACGRGGRAGHGAEPQPAHGPGRRIARAGPLAAVVLHGAARAQEAPRPPRRDARRRVPRRAAAGRRPINSPLSIADARRQAACAGQELDRQDRRLRRPRRPRRGPQRPALPRSDRQPDAAVRRRHPRLPAAGPRHGPVARQAGAAGHRRASTPRSTATSSRSSNRRCRT